MEDLFSYGTLQDEAVQLKLFGRTLNGRFDKLKGYRRQAISLRSDDHSPDATYWIAIRAGDHELIDGMVLELTADELALTDTYEPAEYARRKVELESGARAWVYAAAAEE